MASASEPPQVINPANVDAPFKIQVASMIDGLKGIQDLEVTGRTTVFDVMYQFKVANEQAGRKFPKRRWGEVNKVWQEYHSGDGHVRPRPLKMLRTLKQCGIRSYKVDSDGRLIAVPEKENTLYIRRTRKDPPNPLYVMTSCICMLAFLLVASCFLVWCQWPFTSRQTALVIDAGSVHTTISIYQWGTKKLHNTGIIQEDESCEILGGISSFANNPKAVQQFILGSECFQEKLRRAKIEASGNLTYLFLGATAGMRVLSATNPTAASQIMGNISEAFRSTGLHHSGPYAEILNGTYEGLLGWVTVNSVLNSFESMEGNSPHEGHSYGALDWGGASAQITFEVKRTEPVTPQTENTTLYGTEYTLFTQSNLCYGQAEAARRYFVQLIYDDYNKTGEISFKIPAPCQPKSTNGTNFNMTAADLFYSPCTILSDEDFQRKVESMNKSTVFQFVGQSNSSLCQKEIERQFDVQHCMDTYEQQHCFNSSKIPLPLEGDWLAFSTYWYVMDALNLTRMADYDVTVRRFTNKTRDLCQTKDVSSLSYLRTYGDEAIFNTCFKANFMSHLLVKAYRFKNFAQISFVKRVSKHEIGWTLGYMLEKSVTINNPFVKYDSSFGTRVSLTVSASVVTLIACFACYLTYRYNHRYETLQYTRFSQMFYDDLSCYVDYGGPEEDQEEPAANNGEQEEF